MKTATTLALLLGGITANAAIIVDVNGPITFSASVAQNQAVTAGFTTGQAYNGVTISAYISGLTTSAYTAYLTTSIGAGTTVADQVATVTLNFPGTNPGSVTPIFTGLNLAADTYYLTIFNPDTGSGAWSTTNAPSITTAPGSSHTFSGYFITNGPLPYPPAATFADLPSNNNGSTLIYSVTTAAPAPEPPTTLLAGVGVVLIWFGRRKLGAAGISRGSVRNRHAAGR